MKKRHTYKTQDDLTIELLKGKAEPVGWFVYEDNRMITPVSPLITLRKPNLSNFPTPVVNMAMTVLNGGALEFIMPAENTAEILENCGGTVSYSHNGGNYVFGFLFDIVRSRLEMTIADDDLFSEFPPLRDSGYREISAASGAGTTTSLVDTARLIHQDDYWTGGTVEFPATGEARNVVDFDSATSRLTFDPPLAAATAMGTKYVVTRSFRRERVRAFQDILERLRNSGRRAALIMDSHQLRTIHIFLTLAKIFRGFLNSDVYQTLSREYSALCDRLFQELRLDYDINGDSTIVRDEKGFQTIGTIGRA